MNGAMRVSVVATGIDASEVVHDVPVPRRSLAQPLASAAEIENAEEVQDAPAQEEAHPLVAESQSEPSLFSEIDAERAAAEDQMEDIFEPETAHRAEPEVESAEDDVPAPAYKPRFTITEAVSAQEGTEPDEFVAPRAPAAGTPSPEALARLSAAVSKTPQATPVFSAAGEKPAEETERPN